jgi:hypothetical protein
VLLGLFVGTAVGAGYLLAGVPNVELMTIVIALCGAVVGARRGFAAGILAAAVFSLGSPYGLPVPLLLVAQALGLGAAGLLGAWGGNRVLSCRFKGHHLAALSWAAATGLGSTLIYDLLTNLAIIGAFELDPLVILAGAVPFALVHVGSNTAIFAVLMPLLLPRLAGLNRAALVGRSIVPVLVLCLAIGIRPAAAQTTAPVPPSVVAPAVADSLAGGVADSTGAVVPVPPLEGPALAFGWQRPLWTPFARTALEWLHWHSRLAPVVDGGLGAPAVVLGEAGSTAAPLFVRDGVPLGTGHALADDLWLVPTAGLTVAAPQAGADGWGGTGGVVNLTTDDPDPDKAVSSYHGVKGRHETYFRSIRLLTPRAAWRGAFEFEESLDVEGYNFTNLADVDFAGTSSLPFPGHSRIRQSRTRLMRELDAGNRLEVEYANGRLTKDSLPSLGAEHLELWDDALAATMQAGFGGWQLGTRLFWGNRDAQWGDRGPGLTVGAGTRLLETGREGLDLDLARAGPASGTHLRLQGTNWRVRDSLASGANLGSFSGSGDGRGQTARASAGTGVAFGGTVLGGSLGADWHGTAGAGPEAALTWQDDGDKPWWTLTAFSGGRAPRSDELLTPLTRNVAGRELVLLPNPDLDREKTVRLGLRLQSRLAGLDLAVDGSLNRLRDGITWQATSGAPDEGRWSNDLALDSRRITGTVGRQGRFLGWGRLLLEGTWQQSDEREGRAAVLPPTLYLRSHLMWENHFFQEDGILQLALFSTRQGEMADPWDVTRSFRLPARTVHDLLVGFRLVGAHLSVGLRNLTGERTRMSSGAVSSGQELDLRLHWSWVY